MNAKRAAAFLRTLAARLDPPARPPSMADECEAMRRELEAEARAEFGLRNVQFLEQSGISVKPARTVNPESARRGEGSIPSCSTIPDPASPGDVWPRQAKVTPLTRKLRGVR